MGLCEKAAILRLLPTSSWYVNWTWETGNGTMIKMIKSASSRSACLVELVNLAVASIALVTTLYFIIKYKFTDKRKCSNNLLPLHNLRSVFCALLLLVLLLELSESLMTWSPLIQIVSLIAIIFCWILHREAELRDDQALAVSGGIFIAFAVARTWRLPELQNSGLTLSHVRTISTIGTIFFCIVIASFDTYALYRTMEQSRLYDVRRSGNTRVSYRHARSSLLSKLTFHWVVELLSRGYRATLELSDLGDLPEEETTVKQFGKFRQIYKEKSLEKNHGKSSLWIYYWQRVWPSFLIGSVLKLFGDASTLVGPMAIPKIVEYVSMKQSNSMNSTIHGEFEIFITIEKLLENGYFLGLIIFLAAILQSTLSQASTHVLNCEGIRLRTALQALIYHKSLRLYSWTILEEEEPHGEKNGNAHQHRSSPAADIGTLTNVMAEDPHNVMSFFWIGHYIWAIPLKISAIIFLLYMKLGISAIIGAVSCILLVTPMQLYLGEKMSRNLKLVTEKSDARLKLLNEILQGMRLVKLLAWEKLFEERIQRTRNEELRLLDKDSIYWGLITFLTHASSVLTTLFTFGVYFWVEKTKLNAGNVFSSLALFSQLTVSLFIFPNIIPIILQARISTRRLEDFFARPEIVDVFPKKISQKNEGNDSEKNMTFGTLENITEDEEEQSKNLLPVISDTCSSSDTAFERDSESTSNLLDIYGNFSLGSDGTYLEIRSLVLPRRKLTLIVGKTGSGKTSLISAMLGEITKSYGEIKWAKDVKVAYVPQRPWLLNATLRENIIFGSNFNESRYKSVLKACALEQDVEVLPGKDFTRIGEKGINLSGGQKQRIAIARAIYGDADTVIFDDPLSALDQQVGYEIFDQGIQKLLLRNDRTVVMVTHRLELTRSAHHVIAMEDCHVRAMGTISSIESTDPELAAEWREAARRQTYIKSVHKKAKDYWSLVRLVSRITCISVKHKHSSDEPWTTDQDAHVSPPYFVPHRIRKSMLSESRYLAHDLTDLPVPAEEWGIVRRRSQKHANARRTTSLQLEGHPHPVTRQSSTPTILSSYIPTRGRYNPVGNIQNSSIPTQLVTGSSINKEEKPNSGIKDLDDKDEEDSGGLVTRRNWTDYLKAGGWGSGLIYLAAASGFQALRILTDYWLSKWTNLQTTSLEKSTIHDQIGSCFRMYIILSVISLLLSVLNSAAGQWAGTRARKRLHQGAVASMLRAPIIFFERTPIGRVLNRFSADMGVIDKKLTNSFQRLTSFGLLCGSAMVVNVIISPWFIVAAVPMCLVYFFLQKFYRKSARELQRLEGSTRGPVAAHFSETLAGLHVLRASKQQQRFMDIMNKHLDVNANAFLILNTSERWLGIALDYLGSVVVLVSIFAAIFFSQRHPDRVTPDLVGLAINYNFLIPIYLNWVVKLVSEIEMYMGSVARLTAYTKLQQENYRENGFQVNKSWPERGEIIFENVSLRYNTDAAPIVHNLNLRIPAGQKIGICGRTGSGKSSIVMALFQLSEVSEGRILIDGIDLQRLPLLSLRSRLSGIPQDVIMFSGTIRENLDPLSEHRDEELWVALELAQMKDVIASRPEGLAFEVREGGENFSAGQLQLLSMARATLRRNAVVVLDEATSALDSSTEKAILNAVSTAFENKTVITVAHRVASLLCCDRVIVFEKGEIVEEGSPKELAQIPGGKFAGMLHTKETSNESEND